MGGMDSLIQALDTGMEKHGGELRLNSHIVEVLLKDGRGSAHGERPSYQGKAKKGVVSNAPIWNMARILEDSVDDATDDSHVKKSAIILC